MAPSRPKLARSQAWLRRARARIPAATQTLSKGPTQFVQGVAPIFAARAKGAYLWDVDGNKFLDYPMALGPPILGYADPVVDRAVRDQLKVGGITYSLPHPLEVEVAELLAKTIPCAEMTRFGKNGSDVTSAAVRLARAHTGRDIVLQCGYHGWQDWHIGLTTRNRGVPAAVQGLTKAFKYNDLDSLHQLLDAHRGQVACIIMEPMGVEEPKPGFLEGVRKAATDAGALLVFDEIVTGFRFALGGAQAHFKVTPDLAAVGKAMGNGMPIGALVGKAEYMRTLEEVFFSMTFGGETLSLAAAKATITEMRRRKTIPHLWRTGRALERGLRRLLAAHGLQDVITIKGLPPRIYTDFAGAAGEPPLVVKSLFQQEVLRRGILFQGSHNLTGAHGPREVALTLRAYDAACAELADAIRTRTVRARLEPVFRPP
jgi:glutamate-1-semialdehyde aminotransferase